MEILDLSQSALVPAQQGGARGASRTLQTYSITTDVHFNSCLRADCRRHKIVGVPAHADVH